MVCCLLEPLLIKGQHPFDVAKRSPSGQQAPSPTCPPGNLFRLSDTPWTIKGHKVWLPELDWIVVTKDICFSEFKQLETGAAPSHAPVLAGNNRLLHSYTWLPQTDNYSDVEPDEVMPPSLLQYSCQRDPGSQSIQSDNSSYDWEWDHLMAEIEAVGETVMDIDAIAAGLEVELDATPSERGNTMPDSPHTNALDTAPLLETPCSDVIADVYDDVSMIEHGVMGLNAQVSGVRPIYRKVDHSRPRYGQADARELAGTGSRHGRSAVSMETMETEDQAHMRGGPSTATMRTKLKEHTDGYHSGAREIGARGTVAGRRRRSSA
ncbi:uncharacterized protein UHOD_11721 [Ustilago sp. UG-2017b]|nr:uncharacterized protein UHOD_11721 [Ustilago sp. UG-2017b]